MESSNGFCKYQTCSLVRFRQRRKRDAHYFAARFLYARVYRMIRATDKTNLTGGTV